MSLNSIDNASMGEILPAPADLFANTQKLDINDEKKAVNGN